MLARTGEYFISGILSSVCFFSLYLERLAPLILSATLLPSFFLFALCTRSLFSLPFSRSSASLFSVPRDGVSHPTSKRFARYYLESGGHAFARAKSHLRGSPREGHVSSPIFLIFSFFFFLTDGNTRRKLACKDKRRATRVNYDDIPKLFTNYS